MTITDKEELVIKVNGRIQLYTKQELEQILSFEKWNERDEKVMCAQYERDNIDVCEDPIVEEVRTDLMNRANRGMLKYGTTMARKDLKLKDWLVHLYEEQLDSCNYLKAAIKNIENDNN